MKTRTQPYPQRREFLEYKSQVFEIIGKHPRTVFNFFYENNSILKQINEEDMVELDDKYKKYHSRANAFFYGSLFGVFFIDQIFFRIAFPNFRLPYLRLPFFLVKYIGIPFLSVNICENYFQNDVDNVFEEKTQKYNFNYEDFNKAMNIYERAWMSGRFKEFLQKKEQFDWSTVPESTEYGQ